MNPNQTKIDNLTSAIRNIPDFPKPGIQFKDITPVLADPQLFADALELLTNDFKQGEIDYFVGVEARGFIFSAAAALKLGAGFIPVRKPGKLPYDTYEESYDLEYGSNSVCIHTDAIRPGSRVVLMDDLLATGGTAAATAALIRKFDAEIVQVTFLIELAFLKGREKLQGLPVRSLITF
ncbi:MAG: adenine phosphoribosyltransferase [Verrucomicrobia bacterium]|nr:adenine phosphoribosyltransferase [Verrucomicrobiota bacterium]MCF7709107.1 adenine phosphoribosyltransferase [Verrucomicrobiota bacterium]